MVVRTDEPTSIIALALKYAALSPHSIVIDLLVVPPCIARCWRSRGLKSALQGNLEWQTTATRPSCLTTTPLPNLLPHGELSKSIPLPVVILQKT
jgi:hypothetical protein